MSRGAPCCQSAGRRARVPRPALFGTPHKATLYPLGARAKRGCGGNRADRARRGLEAKEVAALLRWVRRHKSTHPRMESHREQRKSGGPTPQAAGPPSDRSRAPFYGRASLIPATTRKLRPSRTRVAVVLAALVGSSRCGLGAESLHPPEQPVPEAIEPKHGRGGKAVL
jgi:hypothetical protein